MKEVASNRIKINSKSVQLIQTVIARTNSNNHTYLYGYIYEMKKKKNGTPMVYADVMCKCEWIEIVATVRMR